MAGVKYCSTICLVSLSHATSTAGVIDGDRGQMRFMQHVGVALPLLTVEKGTKKMTYKSTRLG